MSVFVEGYFYKLKFFCFFGLQIFPFECLCFSYCKNASSFKIDNLIKEGVGEQYRYNPVAKMVSLVVYLSKFRLFDFFKNYLIILFNGRLVYVFLLVAVRKFQFPSSNLPFLHSLQIPFRLPLFLVPYVFYLQIDF